MKKRIMFLATALILATQQSHAGPGSAKEDPTKLMDTAATVKNVAEPTAATVKGTAATVKNPAAPTAATVKGTAATVKGDALAAPTGATAHVVSGAPGPASIGPSVNPEPAPAITGCPLTRSNVDLNANTVPKENHVATPGEAPVVR